MEESSRKKRVAYLDILRILSCFLVIANHTNFVFERAEADYAAASMGNVVSGTVYLAVCKCAVTVFLMISGSLLLRRVDTYEKCLRRAARILAVILLFSIPYFLIGDFELSISGYIAVVGRSSATTAYWYLYLYLGLMLMLPVLQRLASRFEKRDYLYFFVFALFLCTFDFFVNFNPNFRIPVFAVPVGIFFLGYYLDTFVACERRRLLPMAAAVLVLLAMLSAYTIWRMKNGSDYAATLLQYDNVCYIAISACLFLGVKTVCTLKAPPLKERTERILARVGEATFGIYLLSDLGIYYLKPLFEKYNNLLSVMLLDLVVFALGYLVTEALKRIPLVRRLV